MTERVSIIVEASVAHGDFLTVQDAMRQVLDFFELLERASTKEDGVEWRLVSVNMNSPLHAVAEAISAEPELPPPDEAARTAKAKVKTVLHTALAGELTLTNWAAPHDIAITKRMAARNLNGVGRTTFSFDDESAPVLLYEHSARAAIEVIQEIERTQRTANMQLAGEEVGSVIGDLLETTSYFHKPALRVREQLSGEKIVCVLSDEFAARIGPQFNWDDTWRGSTIEIEGLIKRDETGRIVLVRVEEIERLTPPTSTSPVSDRSFTNGAQPYDYLRDVWGDEDE